MKVLIYTELFNKIKKSGIGKATEHQIKALEENNVEVILDKNRINEVQIVHLNYYGIQSYFLAKKARKLNKKIIYNAHSTEEDFKNSFIFSNQIAPLFKKWICKCYKQGDLIVTPTEYSKSILENYNLDKPIKVISNGIDLNYIKKDKNMGEKFRKKYNIKKNEKVIISVGLYFKRKGLIDFAKIAESMPEYKFIWFGYTPKIFLTSEIKNILNKNIPNLIFAGYVEQDELIKAYSGCDLFLFLTYEETEGIVLLEALASKAKILIRDIPIYSKEFIDGKNIYKGKKIDELKKKIKLIVENKVDDLTEEGYKVVQEKNLSHVGKELKELYLDAIKNKS